MRVARVLFFFVSKIFDVFLSPLTWALCAWGGSVFLSRSRRRTPSRRRWALRLGGFGLAVVFVFAMPWVADRLVLSLERDAVSTISKNETYDVVVLLGGLVDDEAMETWDAGPSYNDNVERMLAAFDLLREGRAKHVIVSGGSWRRSQRFVEADVVAGQLVRWGIAPSRVLVEDRARNTYENAVFSKAIVEAQGFRKVVVVTSAFHMARAAACFGQVGMSVDLFPVDYRSHGASIRETSWLPRSGALATSSAALRELFGQRIYRLRGYSK